jgi:hypothetical protein
MLSMEMLKPSSEIWETSFILFWHCRLTKLLSWLLDSNSHLQVSRRHLHIELSSQRRLLPIGHFNLKSWMHEMFLRRLNVCLSVFQFYFKTILRDIKLATNPRWRVKNRRYDFKFHSR